MESLAVKFMGSSAFSFVALGVVGAMVSMFNAWIKTAVEKTQALRELRKNPYCKLNAKLVEFRDESNRVLLSECTITRFRWGVIVLQSAKGSLVLTCREYKAGYAIYKA